MVGVSTLGPVMANRNTLKAQSVSRFGTQNPTGGPRFIAPMVLEGAPKFDPKDPGSFKFYLDLIPKAQSFSRPLVSGRQIGEVAIGESGRVYLGTNLEVKGSTAADTVHGEPFLMVLAKHHGEKKLNHIFLSAPPCGFCRQSLRELGHDDLQLHFTDFQGKFHSKTLGELYPVPFTYATEDINPLKPTPQSYFDPYRNRKLRGINGQAYNSAMETFMHKPQTRWAGLVVQLANGKTYTGTPITVSGTNPTITPIQEVMVKMTADQVPYSAIVKAAYVEPANPDYSFYQNTKTIMGLIAPNAKLKHIALEPNSGK